jgi:hypothetical protein
MFPEEEIESRKDSVPHDPKTLFFFIGSRLMVVLTSLFKFVYRMKPESCYCGSLNLVLHIRLLKERTLSEFWILAFEFSRASLVFIKDLFILIKAVVTRSRWVWLGGVSVTMVDKVTN